MVRVGLAAASVLKVHSTSVRPPRLTVPFSCATNWPRFGQSADRLLDGRPQPITRRTTITPSNFSSLRSLALYLHNLTHVYTTRALSHTAESHRANLPSRCSRDLSSLTTRHSGKASQSSAKPHKAPSKLSQLGSFCREVAFQKLTVGMPSFTSGIHCIMIANSVRPARAEAGSADPFLPAPLQESQCVQQLGVPSTYLPCECELPDCVEQGRLSV